MEDILFRVFEAEAAKVAGGERASFDMYRMFEIAAAQSPEWPKVQRLNWRGLLKGQAARLRALGQDADGSGRLLISALGQDDSTIDAMIKAAATGHGFGYAVRIAHNKVSDFLKDERPLHRIPKDSAPGGSSSASGTGSDGGGPSGAAEPGRRIASQQYQPRYAPLDAAPTLLLRCGVNLEQQVDLQRAATTILTQLARFAVINPEDATVIEHMLVRDEEPEAVQEMLGVNPGALRQRVHMARKRFLKFIGAKQASELRALVGTLDSAARTRSR